MVHGVFIMIFLDGKDIIFKLEEEVSIITTGVVTHKSVNSMDITTISSHNILILIHSTILLAPLLLKNVTIPLQAVNFIINSPSIGQPELMGLMYPLPHVPMYSGTMLLLVLSLPATSIFIMPHSMLSLFQVTTFFKLMELLSVTGMV